jgi:hypothetical protein
MSDRLESNGLKFLEYCIIDTISASTLLLSNSFIKIFHFWTKDKPRWMTPIGLFEKAFLMHMLFLVVQIVQVIPAKQESPV